MQKMIGTVLDLFVSGSRMSARIKHSGGEILLTVKDPTSLLAATIRGAAAYDDEIEITYKPAPAWMNDIGGEIVHARVVGYQVEELPYAA